MLNLIKDTLLQVKSDIDSVMRRDPAARSVLEVIFLYPSFRAVLDYRTSHWFHKKGMFFIARAISQHSRSKTGIEIHPAAKIGKGLFIDHGSGVVIGETTKIGDNCTIYQGVTLGGTGKETGKRHPTLGNNVMVGTGAKVLGPFKIGDNSKIAANAVVLKEIPPNCTAVGVPAKIVRRCGKKIEAEYDLNQVDISDPIDERLDEFVKHIEFIEGELDELMKILNKISNKCEVIGNMNINFDSAPPKLHSSDEFF